MARRRSARATCATCGLDVPTFNTTGTLCRHTDPAGATCAGSNSRPRAATATPTSQTATIPEEPNMPALPRATCPRCGSDVALRKGGELREHNSAPADKHGPPVKCPAAGLTVEEARAAMPDATADSDTIVEAADDTARSIAGLESAVAEASDPGPAAQPTPAAPEPTPSRPVQVDLGDTVVDAAHGTLFHLPPSALTPSPNNPRHDLGDLEELAASIKAVGLVEPIVARRLDGGVLEVIAGHRRHAAGDLAGAPDLPVIVRDGVTDEQAAELALIENLHRKDLDPLEEADAFRRLTTDFGYSQAKLAKRLGCSQGHISKRLALLKLPDDVQHKVTTGAIRVADAVDLAALGAAKAAAVVAEAERHARSGGDALADEVAVATRRARAEADQAAKVKARRKDLEAAGVRVLDRPAYNHALYDTGWKRLADIPLTLEFADNGRASTATAGMTDDEHRGFPCHGAIIWADADVWTVCTDPDTHLDAADAARLAALEEDRGVRRTGQSDEAADERRLQDEAHQAAWSEANASRAALIGRLIKDRLPAPAVAEFVAANYAATFDDSVWFSDDTVMTAAELLGSPLAEDDERPWRFLIDDLIYNHGPVTTALALGLTAGSDEVARSTRNRLLSTSDLSPIGAGTLRFLAAHGGYQLTDSERDALDRFDAETNEVAEAFGAARPVVDAGSPDNLPDPADEWEEPTPPRPDVDDVKPVHA